MDSLKNIIIFSGKKQSGKDTCGEYIVQQFKKRNLSVHSLAFADNLKFCVNTMFDLSENETSNENKDKIIPRLNTSPRKLYQYIGTEVLQKQMKELFNIENIHHYHIIKKLNTIAENNKNNNFVFTDVRFNHEYDLLKNYAKNNNYNFISIRVNRKYNNNYYLNTRDYNTCNLNIYQANDSECINFAHKTIDNLFDDIAPHNDSHISENIIVKHDIQIDNDDSLDSLYYKLDKIFKLR